MQERNIENGMIVFGMSIMSAFCFEGPATMVGAASVVTTVKFIHLLIFMKYIAVFQSTYLCAS